MSMPRRADSRAAFARRAAALAFLLSGVAAPCGAQTGPGGPLAVVVQPPASASPATPGASGAYERLIVRVVLNGVARGDLPALRDRDGRILVPASAVSTWKLGAEPTRAVDVDGERYVDPASLPGLQAAFDAASVTLELRVAGALLPGTTIDLAPQRRPGVIYPADTAVFLNYGFNASGDDTFADRRYQFTTELGARYGNWLFYNTTNNAWGASGPGEGFVRLLTNAQYDDRENLRRLTLGDFFTPAFDVSSSVPMGGVSLSKLYAMDPYFVQYPTAAFRTEVALPSTVVVRVDGNVLAERQVQPGPLDIANITGVAGAQNVSVVLRDAFGREREIQQPFFFAINAGLAEGLHEYSYNVGFVRRQYGVVSDDYGDLAASAFHRYAFTNAFTAGLRGQATRDLYNVGPFATWQSPELGILAAGVSLGGRGSDAGGAVSGAYSYTGRNVSFGIGARYFSRDFAQLADLVSDYRPRNDRYASASAYDATLGTVSATYTSTDRYDGPASRVWTAAYTRSLLSGKALLSLNYARTVEPASTSTWLLSLRYYFDTQTSIAAGIGRVGHATTPTLSLDRATPQGEGFGYSLTAGHRSGSDDGDGTFGQAFAQVNAQYLTVGGYYARASRANVAPGFSQVFVAGSLGGVDGTVFAARPVQDSFAVVRIPDMPNVPVHANGWLAGTTDSRGVVVATNLVSYYDNSLSFGSADLGLDYAFESSERVISPPARSGTLVAFAIRRNRAIVGTLVGRRDGRDAPLEFREIRLVRDGSTLKGFTARRGEFYLEGVEPGVYELRADGDPACSGRVVVPELTAAVTSVGDVVCHPPSR